MGKIRVLLANHPMMIPDVLRQMIADQDDMELVGDARGPMKILQEIGRSPSTNFRYFDDSNIMALRKIRSLQAKHYSLKEIQKELRVV